VWIVIAVILSRKQEGYTARRRGMQSADGRI